ncbi:MAG: VOC family protein [Candidatus Eremiobacteraeota bacterium]|nr:VOC family protein [Candidatus Eremiobacteraeota bacterium]
MIKDVAFISYSVSDVPRARAFYRDVIGLTPSKSGFGDQWVEIDVGETTFGIGNGETIGIKPGSVFAAAFEVDDVAAMRERLLAQGVEVSEVHDSPVCQSAFVTDPDGNRFAIHQRKQGQSAENV